MKVITTPELKGISKKNAGHLASLINSSHCAMILMEHANRDNEQGKIDFDTYHRRTETAFKMHDDAMREINRLLGVSLTLYRNDPDNYSI